MATLIQYILEKIVDKQQHQKSSSDLLYSTPDDTFDSRYGECFLVSLRTIKMTCLTKLTICFDFSLNATVGRCLNMSRPEEERWHLRQAFNDFRMVCQQYKRSESRFWYRLLNTYFPRRYLVSFRQIPSAWKVNEILLEIGTFRINLQGFKGLCKMSQLYVSISELVLNSR